MSLKREVHLDACARKCVPGPACVCVHVHVCVPGPACECVRVAGCGDGEGAWL